MYINICKSTESTVYDTVYPVWFTGNEFQITLREVQGATRDEVGAAVEALKEQGFINYYGLQRFGSGSSPTHK